jgi:hypothetical protein
MNYGCRRRWGNFWFVAVGASLLTLASWASQAAEQDKESADKAEIARQAYDRDDSRPVENWFGCSPEIEDIEDSEDRAGEPSDAPVASKTESSGNCSAEQPDKSESSKKN